MDLRLPSVMTLDLVQAADARLTFTKLYENVGSMGEMRILFGKLEG
jgi:hypothetical protein